MAQRPREIAPDVFHVTDAGIANVYMVRSPGCGWVLIDTGIPATPTTWWKPRILASAACLPQDPATHWPFRSRR